MKDEIIDYADDYAITKTEKVGFKEFFIGEKEDSSLSKQYISGTVDRKFSNLGIVQYKIDAQFSEYCDVLEYYHIQMTEEIKKLKREIANEPKGIINRDDCYSIYDYETLKGKIVVLDQDVLLKEYQRSSHQLYLADGGFGCLPKGNGNAIYAYNLYTGKETRIEKYNVIGVIKEDKMPEWAIQKLDKLKQKIKESKETVR